MVQNLLNAVLITVIGMGLVFVAILLLWGLMALLVLIKDGAAPEEETVEAPPALGAEAGQSPADARELGLKQSAVAAAVATALAAGKEQTRSRPLISALIPGVSAWQAFHRTNLIGNKQTKGHWR